MSHILTFVASDKKHPLSPKLLKSIAHIISHYDASIDGAPAWLAKKKAADISLIDPPGSVLLMHLRDEMNAHKIDVFYTREKNRRKKLLLADMDSTIVTSETLDELAAHAGLKNEIAAITMEAMEGRLDFHEAIKKRVSLLKDLPTSALEKTLKETQISPGAETLIKVMKANGATCILVSGGFTFFTEAIAAQLGFDQHHGNQLDINQAVQTLTGKITEPIQDKHTKLHYVKYYSEKYNLSEDDVLTIGDGANDLPMLGAAALGIGYHSKHVVAEQITNNILHGDLTAALYVQGFTDKEIKVASK